MFPLCTRFGSLSLFERVLVFIVPRVLESLRRTRFFAKIFPRAGGGCHMTVLFSKCFRVRCGSLYARIFLAKF